MCGCSRMAAPHNSPSNAAPAIFEAGARRPGRRFLCRTGGRNGDRCRGLPHGRTEIGTGNCQFFGRWSVPAAVQGWGSGPDGVLLLGLPELQDELSIAGASPNDLRRSANRPAVLGRSGQGNATSQRQQARHIRAGGGHPGQWPDSRVRHGAIHNRFAADADADTDTNANRRTNTNPDSADSNVNDNRRTSATATAATTASATAATSGHHPAGRMCHRRPVVPITQRPPM